MENENEKSKRVVGVKGGRRPAMAMARGRGRRQRQQPATARRLPSAFRQAPRQPQQARPDLRGFRPDQSVAVGFGPMGVFGSIYTRPSSTLDLERAQLQLQLRAASCERGKPKPKSSSRFLTPHTSHMHMRMHTPPAAAICNPMKRISRPLRRKRGRGRGRLLRGESWVQ